MDRLPMLDGPARLRNFCVNERNRLRKENPEIDRLLMLFLETLPEETFASDPRMYGQYGAGFGYFERGNRGNVSASPHFMPDVTQHAFNAFFATLPYKSVNERAEDKLFDVVHNRLRGGSVHMRDGVDESVVEEAVAFVGGYRLVSEY